MFQRHENGILNYFDRKSNDKQLFGKKWLYAIFQDDFGNTKPGHENCPKYLLEVELH